MNQKETLNLILTNRLNKIKRDLSFSEKDKLFANKINILNQSPQMKSDLIDVIISESQNEAEIVANLNQFFNNIKNIMMKEKVKQSLSRYKAVFMKYESSEQERQAKLFQELDLKIAVIKTTIQDSGLYLPKINKLIQELEQEIKN